MVAVGSLDLAAELTINFDIGRGGVVTPMPSLMRLLIKNILYLLEEYTEKRSDFYEVKLRA